jgi:Nitrile hydratase, alpha chain
MTQVAELSVDLQSIPRDRFSLIQVERALVARAFRDTGFRSALLRDARGILEAELGPLGDRRVFVHEERNHDIHLIVPAASPVRRDDAAPELVAILDAGRTTRNGDESMPRSLAFDDLTRDAIEDEIVRRSHQDAAFRAQLLSDPRGVLEEQFEISVPSEWSVHVHEETAGQWHFLLPRNPEAESEARFAIDDERLRALAFSCVDACYTAGATVCGTCTLVTYCTQ